MIYIYIYIYMNNIFNNNLKLELDDEKINIDDFDNELYEKFNNCKNKINNSKKKLIQIKQNDKCFQEKIYLSIKKNELIEHIQNKLNKLYQKLRLIELKNINYKKMYNLYNIGIIILSTASTVIESAKTIFIDNCIISNTKLYSIFQMSPIIFSSIIACSASILKFKKYQDKMELICKINEKGMFTVSELKKIKEELVFCENIDRFKDILDKYKTDIYIYYINISQEIERLIKNNDYDKYLENIYNTDYKIHILEQKRKYFFKNYEIDENVNYTFKKCKNNCL
mgnify:CR=1 FL=1